MSFYYYIVHLEEGSPSVSVGSLSEIFALLKEMGFVTIFRYNDKETGAAFNEVAEEYCVPKAERERRPVFVLPATSDDGAFVESEEFWIENYLLEEFYNPELLPYVERFDSQGE